MKLTPARSIEPADCWRALSRPNHDRRHAVTPPEARSRDAPPPGASSIAITTVRLDDPAGDRESETGTDGGTARRCFAAHERRKDPFALLERHARLLILNLDDQAVVASSGPHRDGSARRVSDRDADEVADGDPEPAGSTRASARTRRRWRSRRRRCAPPPASDPRSLRARRRPPPARRRDRTRRPEPREGVRLRRVVTRWVLRTGSGSLLVLSPSFADLLPRVTAVRDTSHANPI